MSPINFIIFILFVVYFVCVWNSTKEFETLVMRVSYMAIGTIFIAILTLILFQISKLGVSYPKQEMIGQVRKIVLLVFVPINSLIVLTQFSSIFMQVKSGMVTKEELSKKIKILGALFVFFMIIECIYFKNIQYGILSVIYSK